jgi:parvulin-like peptidyl-prolyl isomerase
MDMEGYRRYVHTYLEKEALKTALENRIGSNVTVTDEEVKDYYDSLLESQQGLYGEGGESDYISDEESYERYGGDPVLIVPEGYIRVRTITVSPDSGKELPEEYEANKAKLEDMAKEYGALSMEDASKNAARLKEIKAEYTELKAATDAMFEAYTAEAKAKAEEALQKIEGGMGFEEALLTYGEDSMYTDFPGFVETGILMMKDADSEKQEYPDIARAAANLEPGQHTGIIQVGEDFYIVQYVGEEPAGTKEFDAVREKIEEAVRTGKADTAWAEQEAEWVKDKSLVTYYEDVYRDIGKKKG